MHNVSPVACGKQLNMAHPLLRGLMAWWPLTCEDPAGGDAKRVLDISPYRCHGTKSTTGIKSNSQGSLFGSSGRVIVPWKENLANIGREWSMSVWIRLLGENAGNTNQFIFDAINTASTQSEYRLRLNRTTSPVRFSPYISFTASGDWQTYQMQSPVALTEWQRGWAHVLTTLSIVSNEPDLRFRIWLNGVEQATMDSPYEWDGLPCDRVEQQRGIGGASHANGTLLNGWLRDLIIWRRELTPDEVMFIHTQGGMFRKRVSHRA